MTTFIVLILTTLFTGGVTIDSVAAWVLAPLVIWLVSVLAGIVLPLVLFKKVLGGAKEKAAIRKEV